MSADVYIAGSWRNADGCCKVAEALHERGLSVYCFCHPRFAPLMFPPGSELARLTNEEFLSHPFVRRVFHNHKAALESCRAVVLVQPCGASAHTEAGYAKGRGAKLVVFGDDLTEIAYNFADFRTSDMNELVDWLLANISKFKGEGGQNGVHTR